MKKLLLGLLFGTLIGIFVPRAYTNQEPERIVIGTTVFRLGMEKDAVISKLAELGYEVKRVGKAQDLSEGWVVTEKNERGEYDPVASVSFRSGRLSAASRHWAESWDAGSAKIGKNLYFLAKSFEGSGNTACSIETLPQESPDFEGKETLIHCGRRTITIDVSKYKEQHEETQVIETVK